MLPYMHVLRYYQSKMKIIANFDLGEIVMLFGYMFQGMILL